MARGRRRQRPAYDRYGRGDAALMMRQTNQMIYGMGGLMIGAGALGLATGVTGTMFGMFHP